MCSNIKRHLFLLSNLNNLSEKLGLSVISHSKINLRSIDGPKSFAYALQQNKNDQNFSQYD